MSINAYCGIMGAGKSYEVVSGPLLDAIAAGRRVVTNIDGISEVRVHAYLAETRELDPVQLGRIVSVTTNRVSEEGFFPLEVESEDGATVTPGLVEPGDMVVIDEGWKLWAAGEKILREHVAFFRMHRHFVHPVTKLSCDVVVMVQSIGDLHRMLRPVIELSFVMQKLKSLGQPTRYRVEQYDGWKQNSKTRVATYYRQYKTEIFPLYKSYAGGAGKEAVVDDRQNLLNKRTLVLFGAAVVLPMVAGVWGVYHFFHQKPKVSLATGQGGVVSVGASGATAPALASGVPAPGAVSAAKTSDVSDAWRVLGRFESGALQYVVLADSAGRMRVDSPSSYNGLGAAMVGRVDGQRVAMWSGSKASVPSFVPGGNAK